MRLHLGWLWTGILASALLASACDREERQQAAPQPPDRTTALRIDFGAVPVATRSIVPIELHNGGEAPALYEVRGISQPFDVAPKGSFTIPSRSSRVVEFSFAPTSVGTLEQEAYVLSPDGEQPLLLVGNGVVPAISCTPGLVDFGRVERGRSVRADVHCTNATELPIALAAGPMQGDHRELFAHTIGAGVELPARGSARIPVTFLQQEGGFGPRAASFVLYGDGEPVQTIELRAEPIESALALPAGCVDFGYVQPGVVVERSILVRSAVSRPITIDEIALASGSAYRIESAPPIALRRDDPETAEVREDEAEIVVAFAPLALGDDPGVLRFLDGAGAVLAEQALCGFGGGPQLACSVSSLDFGPVAVGVPRTETIVCTNAGSDDPEEPVLDNLFVESVATGLDRFTARIVDGNGDAVSADRGFAAGESFRIEVVYAPTADGSDEAELTLRSNDGLAPVQTIPLRGTGRALAPCALAVSQQAIDFGIVGPERSLELALGVRNTGTDDCLLSDVSATAVDGSQAFSAGLAGTAVIPAGETLLLAVTFTGPTLSGGMTERQLTGSLRFGVSDPEQPIRSISLRATVRAPCVVATPGQVDMGTGRPGCTARERDVRIVNACATPIEVAAIETATGASCDGTSCPFDVLPGWATAGNTLRPGEVRNVTVAYAPQEVGEHRGVVRVAVAGTTEPYLIPLHGGSSDDPMRTESFVQPTQPKVDVLWVIDNTCSNSAEHIEIGRNLSFFLDAAHAVGADYQLGVTSTDTNLSDTNSNQHGGRLLPVNAPRSERILTSSTPNLADLWAANVNVGGSGDANEKGILAARMALSPGLIDVADHPDTITPDDGNLGFMRPDAALEIVFYSDEADHDSTPIADYLDFFRGLKGYENGHLVQFHGIISDPGTGCSSDGGDGTGERYHQLIEATGGVWQSMCTLDWSATMAAIGEGVFGDLVPGYRLGDKPACAGSCEDAIEVRLGTVSVPARSGAVRRWSYEAATNRIVFAPGHRPAAGTAVDVTYQAACN